MPTFVQALSLASAVKSAISLRSKNTEIGDGSKVSHLSYVGDAKVGKDVNIGCGAITVNYDGYNKSTNRDWRPCFCRQQCEFNRTGENRRRRICSSGSTITHDVAANDLAIARERQVNKPGYAEKLRSRARAKKKDKRTSSSVRRGFRSELWTGPRLSFNNSLYWV